MEIILLLVVIIIWLLYLAIEFIIPALLIYFIFTHPYDNNIVWVWVALLIIWFIARMIVYINKEIREGKNNE